ncbi:MAG: hypothetical protein V3T03_02220 [Candidatus Bipolaricaulota bacterium]
MPSSVNAAAIQDRAPVYTVALAVAFHSPRSPQTLAELRILGGLPVLGFTTVLVVSSWVRIR